MFKSVSKYLTIVLIIFVSTNAFAQKETYVIGNTALSIEGFGKLNNWHPKIERILMNGEFTTEHNVIEKISDLNLSFLFDNINQGHVSASLRKVFSSEIGKEVKLSQINMMVLPTMKMAHLTMDITTAGVKQYSPLLLNYHLEENQTITVTGKQTIWLYQFGIIPKDIKQSHANDKIVLDIKFSLIKSDNMIANSL